MRKVIRLLMAQNCNCKSSSKAPKELTIGSFEPNGRISIGHPYSTFNTVDC
ncbi:MAG: hypothetical protein K9I36_09125 [Bacteroidia bacterium]|nr:hypothetical protein [Bacteroidia bacterium]MCF8426880.1 hypothetical protein [Bacteroidia bacterium]